MSLSARMAAPWWAFARWLREGSKTDAFLPLPPRGGTGAVFPLLANIGGSGDGRVRPVPPANIEVGA